MELGTRPSWPSSRQPHHPVSRVQSPPRPVQKPLQKGGSRGSNWNAHRCSQAHFQSTRVGFSCVTISLLIENQGSVIFLQERNVNTSIIWITGLWDSNSGKNPTPSIYRAGHRGSEKPRAGPNITQLVEAVRRGAQAS